MTSSRSSCAEHPRERSLTGRRQALQQRSQRPGACQALGQLVGDVAGVEVGKDQHVGPARDRTARRLPLGDVRNQCRVALELTVELEIDSTLGEQRHARRILSSDGCSALPLVEKTSSAPRGSSSSRTRNNSPPPRWRSRPVSRHPAPARHRSRCRSVPRSARRIIRKQDDTVSRPGRGPIASRHARTVVRGSLDAAPMTAPSTEPAATNRQVKWSRLRASQCLRLGRIRRPLDSGKRRARSSTIELRSVMPDVRLIGATRRDAGIATASFLAHQHRVGRTLPRERLLRRLHNPLVVALGESDRRRVLGKLQRTIEQRSIGSIIRPRCGPQDHVHARLPL